MAGTFGDVGGARGAPSDASLVREAQSGDVQSLGLLLARHRPRMHKIALSLLGYVPEAEDAVQDAALIALRRIGDLRDPDAVAPWLSTVVRNVCHAQLRARSATTVDDAVLLNLPSTEPDPEELLERQVSGAWIWHVLDQLSPTLRLVTMLRYFTDVTSYESIATVCGVPVGTVRSRLHEARAKLGAALQATVDAAYGDVSAHAAAHRRVAEEMMRAPYDGRFAEAVGERFSSTVETVWPTGRVTRGPQSLIRAMHSDLDDGVRHRIVNVVASQNVVIWEADLVNPPYDPFHCPPGVVWVQSLDGGRVRKVQLLHKPRPQQFPK